MSYYCLNKLLLCVLLAVQLTRADIYMHNARGSNNRLDERTRARSNANRLFDSQNNERGGYNVGNLYYYAGSKLQLEWTNQHSCNDEKAHCEIILQYMCSDTIRDGISTQTIPLTHAQCENDDCNRDFKYGMHETNEYYANCQQRERNKGLFIADQKVGPNAKNTRQNPNGQRYGYECPEERDFYPYWHPTKWIDIAILTNDVSKCNYYQEESENVKERYYCEVPSQNFRGKIPINKDECEKLIVDEKQASWQRSPAHGVDAPECQETQFTRDNHLGNTVGGLAPVFNWTLPNVAADRCVLRMRYNTSTKDYNPSSTYELADVKLFEKVGLDEVSASQRGYVFKNNPSVQMFADMAKFKLNLAINTAQYGRVFQDRSHVFSIRKRPADLDDKKILNLNVRGRRGNIVQVYPATEYDFVPNTLVMSKNDYIHIQWTGSNTNPNGDGQGLEGSDRSNILLLAPKAYEKGERNAFEPLEQQGHFGANYPNLLSNSTFLGLQQDDLTRLALLQLLLIGGNMEELDDAATYFDLNAKKVTNTGVYNYMCTRNNNFSNRDQKGQLIVVDYTFNDRNIGRLGGTIPLKNNGVLIVPKEALNNLVYLRVDEKTRENLQADSTVPTRVLDAKLTSNTLASDFYVINPIDLSTQQPMTMSIRLKRSAGTFESATVYRLNTDFSTMTKLGSSVNDNELKFDTQQGGIYVAKFESNYSVLIGVLVTIFLLVVLVASVAGFLYKNPKYIDRFKYRAGNLKRSTQNEI